MDTREPAPQIAPVSNKKVAQLVRKLRIEPNSVVLLKGGTFMARKDVIDAMDQAFKQAKIDKVVLVVVENFDDLSVLDEKEMNVRGWYRRERIERVFQRGKRRE